MQQGAVSQGAVCKASRVAHRYGQLAPYTKYVLHVCAHLGVPLPWLGTWK